MITPVLDNIIIKGLPLLDADGNEMDQSIRTYRKGEIISVGETVNIDLQVGDIVYLNKSNFFLILGDNTFLVNKSAIFAMEKPEYVIDRI